MNKRKQLLSSPDGRSYLKPFALVTCLFLLWGFAHGLLDVLDKHFQNTLHISKAESGFVQFSLYIGYLAMAYPAGVFMKRHGYKKGIILGLCLFAGGAFLFYPAAKLAAYLPFLGSLFVIACGLSCLETAANPYTTVLGPKEGAARRINIAQSFNGLGWILGPLMGGLFIFGGGSLVTPYLAIGAIVVVVAVIFAFTKLPAIREDNEEGIAESAPTRELLKHPAFVMAVIAQFLYVAAQTGFNSFFINYVTETITGLQVSIGQMMDRLGTFGEVFHPKNPEQAASLILALGGMGAFWIGRLVGSWLMKFIKPETLLAIYACINTVLTFIVVLRLGWISVIALFSTYFFMSLMFPTIFALGIRGLGPLTKKASSFLVMAVAGGAFCPPLMGAVADRYGMAVAFLIPLFCFAFIAFYALQGRKLKVTAPVALTISLLFLCPLIAPAQQKSGRLAATVDPKGDIVLFYMQHHILYRQLQHASDDKNRGYPLWEAPVRLASGARAGQEMNRILANLHDGPSEPIAQERDSLQLDGGLRQVFYFDKQAHLMYNHEYRPGFWAGEYPVPRDPRPVLTMTPLDTIPNYRPPAAHWHVNDHCFIRYKGKWHMFGIVAPNVYIPGGVPMNYLGSAIADSLTSKSWTTVPPPFYDPVSKGSVLWAPYVVRYKDLFYLFYCAGGDPEQFAIVCRTSPDLEHWSARRVLFREGYQARDPMVMKLPDEHKWVLYYASTERDEGGHYTVSYRTSSDLLHWSAKKNAYTDRHSGSDYGDTESPFVVQQGGNYYLFTGPRPYDPPTADLPNHLHPGYVGTDVFRSATWDHFDNAGFVAHLPVHAPEIVKDSDGQWYISHGGIGQGGLYITELIWNPSTKEFNSPITIKNK